MRQLISLENVSQIFGLSDATTIALDQVDLEVGQGEFLAIMGQSGSGKTSLLNIIGLIDSPAQGLYALSDRETTAMSHRQKAKLRQKRIGFVFQNYNLLPEMTVLDNVCLPLALLRQPRLSQESQDDQETAQPPRRPQKRILLSLASSAAARSKEWPSPAP